MNYTKIFSKLGSVTRITTGRNAEETEGRSNHAFITIVSDSGIKGNSTKEVLNGWAPATTVQITQSVDYGITKSLNKNFLVSEFGDNPVTIRITGFHVFNRPTSSEQPGKQKDSIIEFYKQNRLSSNRAARVQVGITGVVENAQTFECVVLACTTQASQQYLPSGAVVYELTLCGVEI